MRILHLNDHLAAVGGVESYLLALVPELEKRGHEVHVGYASGGLEEMKNTGKLSHLNSIRFRDITKGEKEVRDCIADVRPDVVHLHGIQNAGVFRAVASTGHAVMHGHDYRPICPAANFFYKRSKTICQRTCGPGCFGVTALKHCMTPRPRPALYFYQRSRWIMKNAGKIRNVVAPSRAAADRFVEAGFKEKQVVVNPYFCPLAPLDEPRPAPETPTITFMGRASYNKGWEYFIEALGKLPKEVNGLMVGNFGDEDEASIRRLAAQFGCADRLTIEGWAGRDEIAGVYQRTSVFVFPSLWPETMGIVGVESMSQGVPVVASDVGGVREWLQEGETGYLAKPKDAGSIARGVQSILESPERMVKMGKKGIALVREKFDPQIHLECLLEIYEAAAA